MLMELASDENGPFFRYLQISGSSDSIGEILGSTRLMGLFVACIWHFRPLMTFCNLRLPVSRETEIQPASHLDRSHRFVLLVYYKHT